MSRFSIPSSRTARPRGFTLVELLVVIGIIALLMSILLPVMSKARASATRVRCASNMRQLVAGMVMYSGANKAGYYVATTSYGDDSLESIIPQYVRNGSVANCPGSSMSVDMGVTLNETVGGVTRSFYPHVRYADETYLNRLYFGATPAAIGYAQGGHGYEVFAWAGDGEYPDGVKIAAKYLMTAKNVKRPSETFILIDADDRSGDTDNNNWPDAADHHGTAGFNLAYCDGHVEFVKAADMVRAMLKSRHPWPRDSNDVGPAVALVPGLHNTGGWTGKWWFQ